MDAITKRSYRQFLALYLVSSLTLLAFAGYYFYSFRVSMGTQNFYYKMTHIADIQELAIIEAAMHHRPVALSQAPGFAVALFDAHKKRVRGKLLGPVDFRKDFTTRNGVTTLIAPLGASYEGIKYIVVQTRELARAKEACRKEIVLWTMLIAVLIVIVARYLSAMFLRPLKERTKAIERFVKDTTHELNTPIAALMMSLERLRSKQRYDERIVHNMQLSIQNLYEMYESLAYISFSHRKLPDEDVDFDEAVRKQVEFVRGLAAKKRLHIETELEKAQLRIAPVKAKMLISNLLSNAIKYTPPGKRIRITLDAKKLVVEDEGIGIEKSKLQEIFKRFVRANSYAGGFGVGLSIVKSICDEYGYSVHIDSQPHKGTKVTIQLS